MNQINFPKTAFLLRYKANSSNPRYLQMTNPNYETRLLSFETQLLAAHCKNYIHTFTSEYNKWPSFDLTNNNQTIYPKSYSEETFDILNDINIVELDLQDFCLLNKRSTIICNNFNYDKSGISIRGIEFEILKETKK